MRKMLKEKKDLSINILELQEKLGVSVIYADSSSNFKKICNQYGDTPSDTAIGKSILEQKIIIIDLSPNEYGMSVNNILLHELLHFLNYYRGIDRKMIEDGVYDEYYAIRKSNEILGTFISPVILYPIPNLSPIHPDVLITIARNMAYKHLASEKYTELNNFYDRLEEDIKERYEKDDMIKCIQE